MNDNIQVHRPNRLSVLKRVLLKRETVTIRVPGHPVPVQAEIYRQRPLLLGAVGLIAIGGMVAALHRSTIPPMAIQSALPAPLATPGTGCVPDRVWVVASHVGGVLHFDVNGQRVQSIYYGSGEAVGGDQKPRQSFNGPGFGQFDMMPFLHEGKNRIRIFAEHVKDREWAGIRVTMQKNGRTFHTINQPWDRVGRGEKTLYDQDVEVMVTTCHTQTAEGSQ